MTLSFRHRIRNSSPGGLRPSTLPLGHGGSPQYWLSHVDGEFFQTAETGNRTPNFGVKGSGANHYPRAPAPCWCSKLTNTACGGDGYVGAQRVRQYPFVPSGPRGENGPRTERVHSLITTIVVFNPFYHPIKSLLLGIKMSAQTSKFANVWSQIWKISVIFTHLKLWIAVARHKVKWVKIKINKLLRIKS